MDRSACVAPRPSPSTGQVIASSRRAPCRLVYLGSGCLEPSAAAGLEPARLAGADALLLGPAAVADAGAPPPHPDAGSHLCRAVLQAVRAGGHALLPFSDTGAQPRACRACRARGALVPRPWRARAALVPRPWRLCLPPTLPP